MTKFQRYISPVGARALAVLLCAPVAIACGDDTSEGTADDGTSTGSTSASSTSAGWTTVQTGTSQSSSSSSSTTASEDTTDTGDTSTVQCPAESRRAGDETLIDDLEDGDIYIPSVDGRLGGWYLYNDASAGEQLPMPLQTTSESAAEGTSSIRTYGEGFTSWGAVLGLAFTVSGIDYGNCPYDASSYDGISFWARGQDTIRFHISTMNTATPDQGGRCTAGPGCWDDHGIELALHDEWTQYVVRWEDLRQAGWGQDAAFEPTELLLLHWQDEDAKEFDIWVDEVRLHRGSEDDGTGTGTGDDTGTDSGSTGDAEDSGTSGDATETAGSTGLAAGSGSDGSTGLAEGSGSDGSTGLAEGSGSDGSTG